MHAWGWAGQRNPSQATFSLSLQNNVQSLNGLQPRSVVIKNEISGKNLSRAKETEREQQGTRGALRSGSGLGKASWRKMVAEGAGVTGRRKEGTPQEK